MFDNTFSVFGRLKEVLHEMSSEIDDALEEEGKDEVKIEYRDRGKFEAQLQIAEDILIFSMHSNVFEFNREHIIWQNSYVRDNRDNSYCGIINIYNFLSDSFKYNRSADERIPDRPDFRQPRNAVFRRGQASDQHEAQQFRHPANRP